MSYVEPLTEENDLPVIKAKEMGMKLDEIKQSSRWLINGRDGYAIGLLQTLERPEQDAIEPHVQWFPWARPRELAQAFEDVMDFFTKTKNVIIVTREKYRSFYDALVKREKVKYVGMLEKMPVGDVFIYQAVKQC